MTREEAMYTISYHKHNVKKGSMIDVALDVAISALEQPEIIRCRECKFYDDAPCGIVDWYNTADDFCSYAERREE